MHDPPCAGLGPERSTAVHRVGAGSPVHDAGRAALDDEDEELDAERDEHADDEPVSARRACDELSAGDEDADDRSLDDRHEAIRRLKIDLALARSAELGALEARLYKHVVDCIDFDALFGLEQVLWFAVERLGHGALDNETGLSHRLIERALVRAAHDPHNTFSEVPLGITTAERRAARYDAECPFCEIDDEAAEDASAARHDHERGGESCPLCEDAAREWRTQHADELRAAEARRAARRRDRTKRRGDRGSSAARASSRSGATVLLRRKV